MDIRKILDGLDTIHAELEVREKQEIVSGRCSHCGTPLSVAWPYDSGESNIVKLILVCIPCYAEGDR